MPSKMIRTWLEPDGSRTLLARDDKGGLVELRGVTIDWPADMPDGANLEVLGIEIADDLRDGEGGSLDCVVEFDAGD